MTLRITLVLLISFIVCTAYDPELCRDKFIRNGFIPKYTLDISDIKLKVTFKYTSGHKAGCGNILDIRSVSKAPFVEADVGRACKYLTVLIMDVDYERGAPFLHMLIHNIKASELEFGIDCRKEWEGTAANYYMPGKTGYGSYRMVVLAYCQEHYIHRMTHRYWVYNDRKYFKPTHMAKEYGFRRAIAGTYFNVTYDK
ncbi:uncharacterized protein LOC129217389 [Uloborus diversus]|uniref:uncharacterized protein LOC129217389 n=1 Tax=Uloborus diversus TaxID=327109 RepID=UPI00240A2AB7|nr:uncharacterized protein LOC129217389 [Uloborus diversus]